MKINQVEELVGITKKNIRFYESQGLLRPERDPENGYREYTLKDVEQLKRIRLLRKLDIPCETIRQVTTGKMSLERCIQLQRKHLKKRSSDYQQMEELCAEIEENGTAFDELKASELLERMTDLERGGVVFMEPNKSDVNKRRLGAVISAIAAIVYMVGIGALILWANQQDPLPPVVVAVILLIPAVIVVCIGFALRQRIKELKGGELDEARKY